MQMLAQLSARFIEVLFFTGLVGSVAVVLVSVGEDIHDGLSDEETKENA